MISVSACVSVIINQTEIKNFKEMEITLTGTLDWKYYFTYKFSRSVVFLTVVIARIVIYFLNNLSYTLKNQRLFFKKINIALTKEFNYV